MQDLINFRDFGDCSAANGSRVRADRLYRCGQLVNFGAAATSQILRLDFAIIADLRYVSEQVGAPSPWPVAKAACVVAHQNDKTSAPHLALLARAHLTMPDIAEFYHSIYREHAFDAAYRSLFAEVINSMAKRRGRTLVHCTAGKDRTGLFCALILETLGVDRETVIADYLASQDAPWAPCK